VLVLWTIRRHTTTELRPFVRPASLANGCRRPDLARHVVYTDSGELLLFGCFFWGEGGLELDPSHLNRARPGAVFFYIPPEGALIKGGGGLN
jgi:hypothetical protein